MMFVYSITFAFACALLLVALFIVTSSGHVIRSSGREPTIESRQIAACPPFAGNPDFYGLGIRLGVYLQWLSAWVTNAIDQRRAATNHDANSIFVLAIVIAVFVTCGNDSIRPAEAYIMLLFCFGFFYTVLSHFGLRLYLMNTTTIASIAPKLKASWPKTKQWFKDSYRDERPTFILPSTVPRLHSTAAPAGYDPAFWAWYTILSLDLSSRVPYKTYSCLKLVLSFDTASYLKHPSLSWAGVGWRSAIATLVSVANIWLWFSPWISNYELSRGVSCTPHIFLFGNWPLQRSTITFLKVTSVILATPDLMLCLTFIRVFSASVLLIRDFLMRRLVVETAETFKAGQWDKLPNRYKMLFGYIAGSGFLSRPTPNFAVLKTLFPTQNGIGFWTTEKNDIPTTRELIGAQLSFWSRSIDIETRDDEERPEKPGKLVYLSCTSYHVVLLATIASFIICIELTILKNGISDVYTINTTGQLIPFIIGVVSFIATCRDVLFSHLRKKYPEWCAYYLSLDLALGVMELKKVNAKQSGMARIVPHGDDGPTSSSGPSDPKTTA